jgi:phosphatidylinositol alpha-1,6-mannosyltransferase
MSERRRALIISPDFPPARGGIQLLVDRIAGSLTRLDPLVICAASPGSAEVDAERDFPIIRVRNVAGVRMLTNLAVNVAAIRVGLTRPFDVSLCMHIVTSPAAAFLRRWRGIPFVLYVYAKEMGARPALARFAVRRADRVVAISTYARDLALAAGALEDRVVLIAPGVDAPPDHPPRRDTAGERDGARVPTIVTVARLEDRYKGHDVMLRAMPLIRAKIPMSRWRVLGDGPLRASLDERAGALGLHDAVTFLGRVSDDERDAELRGADVFCMVSRLPASGLAGEGFGIVYLEANAHRLPVVAGDVGGAVDAVVDGETGVLVDPEDHVAVAEAIVSLLRDSGLARRLGDAGRGHAETFSWRRAADQVDDVLLSVVR